MKLCIIAGMPRAGTTFLYHNLQKHPQIFAPFRKETSYFSVNNDRGIHWFTNLYRNAQPDQIRLDVSTLCFMDPNAIPRILEFNGDKKVALIVRDPGSWALSFYYQILSHEYRVPPFEKFLQGYTLKMGKNFLHLHFQDNFVPARIGEFMANFENNLLLVSFNVLRTNPLRFLQVFEEFLGINRYFRQDNFDDRIINAGRRPNIKFLSYITSRESFISMIEHTVPRPVVLKARKLFDYSSSKPAHQPVPEFPEKAMRLSEKLFAEQQHAVTDLFRDNEVILGTGDPLDKRSVLEL